MWDTIKHTNVCVMEIPEREELEKTKYLEETDSLDRLITRDYREISNKKWLPTKKSPGPDEFNCWILINILKSITTNSSQIIPKHRRLENTS